MEIVNGMQKSTSPEGLFQQLLRALTTKQERQLSRFLTSESLQSGGRADTQRTEGTGGMGSPRGGARRSPRGSLGCVERHSMFGLSNPEPDIGWLGRDRGACYHNPRVCSRQSLCKGCD